MRQEKTTHKFNFYIYLLPVESLLVRLKLFSENGLER